MPHTKQQANTTQAADSAKTTTHFGFEEVSESEKAGLVQDLFHRVAGHYDLMNDLMSVGIHRLWKDAMVDWMEPRAGMQILDMAGGTGDIAFRLYKKTAGKATIVVGDLTPHMLEVGRTRALDRGIVKGLGWIACDAETLPFADSSMDGYTIAFGLRNVTHPERALSEAWRVLKPGGRFMCLEFSHVTAPLLDKIYDLYSFQILPVIGQVVAKDRDAYRYLGESIRRFPNQTRLISMMEEAGFSHTAFRNLSGGIAALHSGWKI